MDLSRRSGVLLHPTALPGRYGRGDLGPPAHAFVGDLAAAGQSVWQVLPLGPPGFGGSPYASGSAFAGDPLLISPELLAQEGLLDRAVLEGAPEFPADRVTPEAETWRRGVLEQAWARFQARPDPALAADLERFRAEQGYWLDDHALFVALKDAHGGGAFWACWPRPLVRCMPHATRLARREMAGAIEEEVFRQFLFDRQWRRLRRAAHEQGVHIFGDIPIFVARDSVDVWSRPELFFLGGDGEPTVVAGVPPDLFTETGQLWGNPLYDWKVHARTGYAWWVERLRHELERSDMIRIDHFRGFASYWEVPAGDDTAMNGRWVEGPRMDFFRALRENLGDMPIVAEDLGEITPDVPELLEEAGFPGMRVLQFAWDGDAKNPFLPENIPERSVVYTGTHDNETTAGWLAGVDAATRGRVLARTHGDASAWGLIELALGSAAFLSIVPAQDLLELGNEARFNTPGVGHGNWSWRLREGQLGPDVLQRLGEATARHGRLGRHA